MENPLITKTVVYLRDHFALEASGHDWWHLFRVWQLSKHLANNEEKVNILLVELSALLHDVCDYKFHNGDKEKGKLAAQSLMLELGYPDSLIKQIIPIICSQIVYIPKLLAEQLLVDTIYAAISHRILCRVG